MINYYHNPSHSNESFRPYGRHSQHHQQYKYLSTINECHTVATSRTNNLSTHPVSTQPGHSFTPGPLFRTRSLTSQCPHFNSWMLLLPTAHLTPVLYTPSPAPNICHAQGVKCIYAVLFRKYMDNHNSVLDQLGCCITQVPSTCLPRPQYLVFILSDGAIALEVLSQHDLVYSALSLAALHLHSILKQEKCWKAVDLHKAFSKISAAETQMKSYKASYGSDLI